MLNPGRRPKNRRFEYEPRFYDPKEEDRVKQRIRLQSKVRRGRRPSFLVIVIIFVLSLLIYISI